MGDRGKMEGRLALLAGLERAVRIARPMLRKGRVVAATLPGHVRALIVRADFPRRVETTRKWVVAQQFPAKARRLGAAAARVVEQAARTAGTAAAFTRRTVAAAAGRMGPVAASGAARFAAALGLIMAMLSRRSAALSATLIERRGAARARKAERKAQRMAAGVQPPKTPEPVPSELMRLLKEEGVEVKGMDVRDALPEPVRSMPIQGVLPLFADDASSGKS